VSNKENAEVLEVLRRQIGQDRLAYLVLAERRLILPEAQAPEPDHHVHDGAPTRHCGYLVGICPRGSLVTARSYYYPGSFSGILKVGGGPNIPELCSTGGTQWVLRVPVECGRLR
jgi:hypothetical protein